MSLILRSRLIICGAAVVAVWLGVQLAEGGYGAPALFAALAFAAIVTRLASVPIDALVLGGLLFGYLVGNRGFAQLMPVPGLPLLPAEIGLLIAGAWIGVRCAFSRELPFRSDGLNWAVLLWLVAGTIRVVFDVGPHGFMAVRDYAMIYYALFFFIAQHIAIAPAARRFLLRMLVLAALLEPLAAMFSEAFPVFLFSHLSIGGVPVIFFKGDLAFTFMAVSAFLVSFAIDERYRPWAWAIGTLELLFVVGGANRASMLGALAALGWLAFSSARRFVALQAGAMAASFLVLAGMALLAQNSWAEGKLTGVTDRIRSVGDIVGTGTYESAESAMKGDNNRFRSMWWQAVVDETLAENPMFGLGFGHDLARNFLQAYNPEIEDFTARSPHSIVVSVIGRMGFIGLGVFILLCAMLVHRTWRIMRNPAAERWVLGLWAAVWVILISACFGVVLEGPMGAVVFWTLLGIANAPSPNSAEPVLSEPEAATTLPQPAAAHGVGATTQ